MRSIISFIAIIAFFSVFFLLGAKSSRLSEFDLLGLCGALALIGVLTISALRDHRTLDK